MHIKYIPFVNITTQRRKFLGTKCELKKLCKCKEEEERIRNYQA